ncbi:hypothetical protein IFM89_016963 [Coptis chinensis]|uniref:Uncharacterized protein n=1 Tax=Coptis chinensis TaxID=261450 RepID=A0A835HTB9_9MAGN|nr:hypothetical protein IFM89_016963 [Coptis chinensis]
MAAIMIGFVLMYGPYLRLAASGGSMGGHISRSASSSSYSRYHRSQSSSAHDNVHNKTLRDDEASFPPGGVVLIVFVLFFVIMILIAGVCPRHTTASVIKLQVCWLGTEMDVQKHLDRIAEVSDTSTCKGLRKLLKETTAALLQYTDSSVSGFSFAEFKTIPQKITSVHHFIHLSLA